MPFETYRLQFVIGERVEAVWPMDSHRYRGTVTQQLPQGDYTMHKNCKL